MRKDGSSPGRGDLLCAAAAVGCIVVFVWMGLGWSGLTSRDTYAGKKGDYYSSLVHGFLSGHLYMDVTPDPGLDSPDPAVRLTVPNLLDASYYRRHFYLYFGVTPAAILLLPYAWLTGGDLDSRFAVVLCTVTGFLFAFGTWRMVLRDNLLRLGAPVLIASVAALGLATATPLLLTRAMFYELCIAAGYACSMAGAFWMYRAISGRRAPGFCLAMASLSLGLAVGCRPSLVMAVPVLAVAAMIAARRGDGGAPSSRRLIRLGAAAVLPAALVGACLAAYNYERFGNPLEFGFHYSQNKFFNLRLPFAGLGYFWTNLRWDYLTLPALGPYFPFVFPEAASFRPPGYHGDEAIHGQFPTFVLAAFVVLSALMFRRRLQLGRLIPIAALVALMFLAPFVALSCLGLRADRYLVDFQPSLVLLAMVLAAPIAAGGSRKLWSAGFVALALAAAIFNVLAGIEQFDTFKNTRQAAYRALERLGNTPSSWLGRAGFLRSGPIELKVVFPQGLKAVRVEPLLTIGTPDKSDSIYVAEFPGDRIEFIADHSHYGGPKSKTIDIVPGKEYTIRVDLGALYPPGNHPFFKAYSSMQWRLVKTRVNVQMGGVDVIDAKMNAYDAPPETLEIGMNDISLSPFLTRFSGHVLSAMRIAPEPPKPVRMNDGLWRIRCVFPMERTNKPFPLLSAGISGSGTLVFVTILSANRVRIGVDEWGVGGDYSDPITLDSSEEHTVEVFMGSLANNHSWPAEWGFSRQQFADLEKKFRIWLDGRLVLDTSVRREFDPTDSFIDVGGNLQGFSTAPTEYFGAIRSDPFTPQEAREFLNHNLGAKIQENSGLWRFRCALPLKMTNQAFPILSAGIAGSGTIVYVKILPDSQVRMGVDEWGIGGEISGPVRVEDLPEHVIEVFVGPLARSKAWPPEWGISPQRLKDEGQKVSVWLDGRRVLETSIRGNFAARDTSMDVGANPQGFSTAQPDFSGTLRLDPYNASESQAFLVKNLAEK